MRIRVILSPHGNECRIPFNYQHSLSSAIYKIIQFADESYSRELHDQGLLSFDGKPIKFFTFSFLFTPHKEIDKSEIVLKGHPMCYFFISSPLIDGFVKNFVIGLFGKKELTIHTEKFEIIKVEPIVTPEFTNEVSFKCLSPIVLSTMREHNGSLKPHYFRPDDDGLTDAVKNNLLRKFTTLYQKEPEYKQLHFELDKNYIQSHDPTKLTKLITLKEGLGKEETKIRGIFVPFKIAGSTELIKLAWEAGLGAHCSQGFGCIDILN